MLHPFKYALYQLKIQRLAHIVYQLKDINDFLIQISFEKCPPPLLLDQVQIGAKDV